MSHVVVFAFAVEDGLAPVVGAAPYDVLARQIPRILVGQLNGDSDRGVRFFPFLGPVDGARSFLRLREPLDPKALVALHKQEGVDRLVDGVLRADRLTWRIMDGDGAERLRVDLAFDPRDPLAVLPRLTYELVGQLGWTGSVDQITQLKGEALGWFLVLKDEMLRREADLPDASSEPLRAAARCVELAGADVEVQQLVMDFLALLLRKGVHRDAVAPVANDLAAHLTKAESLDRLAGLMFAAGDKSRATSIVVRAACLRPQDSELAERAAAMAFQSGDDASVRAVVEHARAAGAATPKLIAQLAASLDRNGDFEGRNKLVDELVGEASLPVPVARLVVSFLLDEDQPAIARTILQRTLQRAPDQSMLHYELGRSCLLLGEPARAGVALQRAIDLGVSARLLPHAKRLLRVSTVPGLWQGSQLVEKALAADDLPAALSAVRALVRRVGPIAEAWLLFGVVEHRLGRRRRAERLLRRALAYDADCADAHNRLGALLLEEARNEESYRHLLRAFELAPEDSATLVHLAQAAARIGRLDEARQHLRAAAQFGASSKLVSAVLRKIEAA
ncbi:MAG: hypothetical protein CMJ88_04590 [Planctomycetes bacterium]|nr:hypothetical protein [Planctomycetota bacterium]